MRALVVGAGVMGVTTAYFLQRQGCEVVVLDRHSGPAQGASRANGGFFSAGLAAPWSAPGAVGMAMRSQLDPTAAFAWKPDFTWRQAAWMWQSLRECRAERFAVNRARLTRMAIYALDCLAAIEADLPIEHERSRNGVLHLFREPVPQAMVDGFLRYLSTMKVSARFMGQGEVFAGEPALARSTPGLFGALHIPGDLSGDCERFVGELTRNIQARGGKFVWNATVQRLHAHASGKPKRIASVQTSAGPFTADAYVFATGADSAALLRGWVPLPVYPIKGYSLTALLLQPDAGPQHSMFDFKTKTGIARLGERVRLSGIAEIVGYDRKLSPARGAQLMQTLEQVFPGAVDSTQVSHWAELRPATPDGVPYVSATAVANLFINTGHGGNGWSMSCGSGKLMADLVLGRATDIDWKDYALQRGSHSVCAWRR